MMLLGVTALDIDATACASALSDELETMANACEHWPAMWHHAAEQGERMLGSLG